jgi:hypothetical protein
MAMNLWAVLVGAIAAIVDIFGFLRLYHSLGNQIEHFDTTTRDRIKLLKPKMWDLVVQSPTEEFYDFFASRLQAADRKYKSVADVFQDVKLQNLIMDHLIPLPEAFTSYKDVMNLREGWRNALVKREKYVRDFAIVFLLASISIAVCGFLFDYLVDYVFFFGITLVVVLAIVLARVLMVWRNVIKHREIHARLLDLVENDE